MQQTHRNASQTNSQCNATTISNFLNATSFIPQCDNDNNINNTQRQFGVSPIAPGQKPAFLALYAGFTIALNLLRPFRFALSMAITPTFEKIRKYIQRKFGVSAKMSAVWMAVGINLFGTCTLMGVGVGLASLLSGVPVWAR